jgi:hypothetical protein
MILVSGELRKVSEDLALGAGDEAASQEPA